MLTFKKALKFTRQFSSHTAFEDEEAEAYFDFLMLLSRGSRIVEIGLQFGRSSSIALQVAKERGLHYIGIDPFSDEYGEKARPAWMTLAKLSRADWTIFIVNSHDYTINCKFQAILIDGDHSYEAVKNDCEHFLPHVTQYAFFHDMVREVGATKAVDEYMAAHPEWTHIGIVGSLGIWRRK